MYKAIVTLKTGHKYFHFEKILAVRNDDQYRCIGYLYRTSDNQWMPGLHLVKRGRNWELMGWPTYKYPDPQPTKEAAMDVFISAWNEAYLTNQAFGAVGASQLPERGH